MRGAAKILGTVILAVSLSFTAAFAGGPSGVTEKKPIAEAITNHISVLKSGKPQERAAAAYWLGQQHSAAAIAVEQLVGLLGDSTQVNPSQYRAKRVLGKLTLGEEVAAALVNIGHPSIDPLIRVLKTSPDAEARKNAAWALGALHDTGSTGSQI